MAPLLIFDLDGTLIDSAQDIASALNKTMAHMGRSPVPYEVVVSHIGEGLRQLLADFFSEKDLVFQSRDHLVEFFLRTYEEEMFKSTRAYPGVMDFLKSYAGPLGIVTNKNADPARKLLQHLGLGSIPWIEVLGADSLPERKPHPLPLLHLMEKAERSPANTFMIGDGTPDMKAAAAAGVRAIAVNFGYTSPEILKKFKPVASFDDYAELHNLVLRLINH